jgi:hypothetical protein
MNDGFVKSALQGGGTLRLPDMGRDDSRPCDRNHRSGDFYGIIYDE